MLNNWHIHDALADTIPASLPQHSNASCISGRSRAPPLNSSRHFSTPLRPSPRPWQVSSVPLPLNAAFSCPTKRPGGDGEDRLGGSQRKSKGTPSPARSRRDWRFVILHKSVQFNQEKGGASGTPSCKYSSRQLQARIFWSRPLQLPQLH